jgi:hypothetical protein
LYTYLLVFLFFTGFSCANQSSRKSDTASEVQSLKLSCLAPIDLINGITKYDTFITNVFMYKNLYVYSNEIIIADVSTQSRVNTGNTIDASHEAKRYQYVVATKIDSLAFLYDSINSKNYLKVIKKDSFFANYVVLNFQNYYSQRVQMNIDSLLIPFSKESSDTYVEKYFTKLPSAETHNDTSLYFYSKDFEKYNFSFVPMLDSLKRMKLFKIKYLFNPVFSPRLKMQLPARELTVYMEKAEVENPDKIRKLCEIFLKNYKQP